MRFVRTRSTSIELPCERVMEAAASVGAMSLMACHVLGAGFCQFIAPSTDCTAMPSPSSTPEELCIGNGEPSSRWTGGTDEVSTRLAWRRPSSREARSARATSPALRPSPTDAEHNRMRPVVSSVVHGGRQPDKPLNTMWNSDLEFREARHQVCGRALGTRKGWTAREGGESGCFSSSGGTHSSKMASDGASGYARGAITAVT